MVNKKKEETNNVALGSIAHVSESLTLRVQRYATIHNEQTTYLKITILVAIYIV